MASYAFCPNAWRSRRDSGREAGRFSSCVSGGLVAKLKACGAYLRASTVSLSIAPSLSYRCSEAFSPDQPASCFPQYSRLSGLTSSFCYELLDMFTSLQGELTRAHGIRSLSKLLPTLSILHHSRFECFRHRSPFGLGCWVVAKLLQQMRRLADVLCSNSLWRWPVWRYC